MLNELQYYVSAFVQLTVASAFGMALTIGVAGITHADLPFHVPLSCKDCAQQIRG